MNFGVWITAEVSKFQSPRSESPVFRRRFQSPRFLSPGFCCRLLSRICPARPRFPVTHPDQSRFPVSSPVPVPRDPSVPAPVPPVSSPGPGPLAPHSCPPAPPPERVPRPGGRPPARPPDSVRHTLGPSSGSPPPTRFEQFGRLEATSFSSDTTLLETQDLLMITLQGRTRTRTERGRLSSRSRMVARSL
ncbi:hypothetical protein EYF80_049725 [Liparis tanakae]|uniref:Uncharacterized protein n=1 Tax=Liparis tanakae TaxID=230148 RepID=A0A4Z2FFX6_9TELE|nr:hypothetical protein EYF80_049725 [Liparis tanakae]